MTAPVDLRAMEKHAAAWETFSTSAQVIVSDLRALIEHARIAREAMRVEFDCYGLSEGGQDALRRMSALVNDGEDSRG